MSIVKLFPFIACFWAAGCLASQQSNDDGCLYTRNAFDFTEPKHPSILFSKWQNTKNAETDENLDRLIVSYENGDVLIVEHRYCAIYSFKAIYHSFGLVSSASTLIEIAKRVQQYNLQGKNLSLTFSDHLKRNLPESSFNNEKSLRINFDAADKKGENDVRYSVSYDPLGSLGLLGSAISLSLVIGAE